MNKPIHTPGPYLDEIDARIAEANQWGNDREAQYATWQRGFIIRQHRLRVRLEERKASAVTAKATGGAP